ncbi:MAG: DegT/DnrJ/EryC1/StrS family aminotransferase [Verrucomicrobiota bacterium JB025]|nr:DegT/DnrJ/EryC1/StrS family aminotransferase [Verrucomicrobiota bacterium JB025]
MKVPYSEVAATNGRMKDELLATIGRVIDSGCYSGGPFVEAFEDEFAAYCGTKHAVAVSSGTSALWLAMMAMEIGPGDEVVTVPATFVATVEAILATGATPVFADIDESSYTMSPEGLERAISARTKAVVPVHLFGQTAEMGAIREIAAGRGLRVIEDAAQAHGASCGGRRAGALGDAGCFSFYPSKNLGALGEGGAVTTDDDLVAERVRELRNHGQSRKNHHVASGWNCRMDGVQAAVLSHKLRMLEGGNQRRVEIAAAYDEFLAGCAGVVVPAVRKPDHHVYHVYAVRVGGRDRFIRRMAGLGVECGVHYPVPVHLQPAFARLGCGMGDFPVAERCAGEFVSLPMYPGLTGEQAGIVMAAAARSCEVEACAGVPPVIQSH